MICRICFYKHITDVQLPKQTNTHLTLWFFVVQKSTLKTPSPQKKQPQPKEEAAPSRFDELASLNDDPKTQLLGQIRELHDGIQNAFGAKDLQKCEEMSFISEESKMPSFEVDHDNTEMPAHTPYGDDPAPSSDQANDDEPEPVIIKITAEDEEEDDDIFEKE